MATLYTTTYSYSYAVAGDAHYVVRSEDPRPARGSSVVRSERANSSCNCSRYPHGDHGGGGGGGTSNHER